PSNPGDRYNRDWSLELLRGRLFLRARELPQRPVQPGLVPGAHRTAVVRASFGDDACRCWFALLWQLGYCVWPPPAYGNEMNEQRERVAEKGKREEQRGAKRPAIDRVLLGNEWVRCFTST